MLRRHRYHRPLSTITAATANAIATIRRQRVGNFPPRYYSIKPLNFEMKRFLRLFPSPLISLFSFPLSFKAFPFPAMAPAAPWPPPLLE